jgi:hypothetical protein
MKTFFNLLSLLVFFALAQITNCQTAWKQYRSSMYHYIVQYPASWYLLPPDRDALDILNFPPSERLHGVVIKHMGAEISVGGQPADISTIDQWVEKDTRYVDGVLEDKEVPVPTYLRRGCKKLRRVVTRADADEGHAYLLFTSYYCASEKSLYEVLLTNWQGDPKENELQAIALKVAESLRTD